MSNPGLYLPAECVSRCISLTGTAFIGALPGTVTAHAAGQKQFSGDVCFIFHLCIHVSAGILPSYQLLQSCEIVDPGGKCRPMCTQEHWDTSTQRLPSRTLPTERQIHTMSTLQVTQSPKKEEIQWVWGYQGMYSHPHTPPCRPPGCWDYGRL